MAAHVVTAIYGGSDRLRGQAEQDVEAEWLCFTDDPSMEAPEPWQVIYEPPTHAHPNMAAKVHKCRPRLSGPDVVWIDASMEVVSRCFVREALAARRDGIAVWRHPRRDCIYDEALASIGAEGQNGKYADQPILEQVAAYREEGHPPHGGLFACGTVAWDLSDPRAVALGAAWLEECSRWSYQDQLSLPVVCRRAGITPGTFQVPQIEGRTRGALVNRWLRIHPHLR